jgi:hypothetical protein
MSETLPTTRAPSERKRDPGIPLFMSVGQQSPMRETLPTTRASSERKRDPSIPLFMGVGPQKRRRLGRRRLLGLAHALPSGSSVGTDQAPLKIDVVDLTSDSS